MPRKVKVVNINEDSSYGDVAEAITENELAENETPEETETQTVEPEPPNPRHERNECPNPKLLWTILQLSLSPHQNHWHPSQERSEHPRRK